GARVPLPLHQPSRSRVSTTNTPARRRTVPHLPSRSDSRRSAREIRRQQTMRRASISPIPFLQQTRRLRHPPRLPTRAVRCRVLRSRSPAAPDRAAGDEPWSSVSPSEYGRSTRAAGGTNGSPRTFETERRIPPFPCQSSARRHVPAQSSNESSYRSAYSQERASISGGTSPSSAQSTSAPGAAWSSPESFRPTRIGTVQRDDRRSP